MNLSASTLYELVFVAVLMLMTALSAIVVVGLRSLLRRWKSAWLKTFVVHAANLSVLLICLPWLARFLPLLNYLGLTHGSVLTFWAAFLIADGVRASRSDALAPSDKRKRWQPVALLVLVAVLGMALTRATNRSAAGKEELEYARVAAPVVKLLRSRSPEREILEAMASSFPEELQQLLDRYIKEVRANSAGKTRPIKLPRFPYREVVALLEQRRPDIARAPDAVLVNLARTLPPMAGLVEENSEYCAVMGSRFTFSEPVASQPVGPAHARALGLMMAASLTAARAGIDHPVKRTFSEDRTEKLEARGPRHDPISSASPRIGPAYCRALATEMRWIGRLPPDDAAYILALRYSVAN